MIVTGKQASIYITSSPVSIINEPTSTIDNVIYQITNVSKRLLDSQTTITVRVNGTAVNLGFTVNYLKGTVTFIIEKIETDVVTITGKFLPKVLVALAHEFSFGKGVDIGDVTCFGNTHKSKLTMQKYAYGTISRWDVTDTFFTDALLSGIPKYIIFDSGVEGAEQQILLAYFEKEEIKAVVSSPQDATVGFISANEQIT